MKNFSGRIARDHWVALLILLAAAFALYARTFGCGWTYDDFPVIVDNPDIRSLAAFLKNTYAGRPLRELTYLFDHALFGLQPAGWHIQNIFWHGLNAGLVWLLVVRLGGRRLVAGVAAVLFLVHPLQVEVVANISHRKDSLVLAFSLLAVLAWTQGFREGRRRWGWLSGAMVLGAIALAAKQNAVALPLVFAAYEWGWVPKRQRLLLRFPVAGGLVLAALGLLAGAWWLDLSRERFYEGMAGLLQMKANYFREPTLGVYLRMVLKSWAFMFGKLVWPTRLALEYTYAVPAGWLNGWVLAALAGLAGYGGALWASARRSPLAFFSLIWIGAFWLPVSNLWPLTYFAADRYLYAPSVGVFILFGLGLRRLCGNEKALRWAIAVLALALTFLTWQQEAVWKSPATLWTQAAKVSPESSFALNNLGNIALLDRDRRKATEYYGRALQANPGNPTASYNLGMLAEERGDLRQALKYYRHFANLDNPAFRQQRKQLRLRLYREYGISL
jgi:tetratricopeptide (TPR) repeat protein